MQQYHPYGGRGATASQQPQFPLERTDEVGEKGITVAVYCFGLAWLKVTAENTLLPAISYFARFKTWKINTSKPI